MHRFNWMPATDLMLLVDEVADCYHRFKRMEEYESDSPGTVVIRKVRKNQWVKARNTLILALAQPQSPDR